MIPDRARRHETVDPGTLLDEFRRQQIFNMREENARRRELFRRAEVPWEEEKGTEVLEARNEVMEMARRANNRAWYNRLARDWYRARDDELDRMWDHDGEIVEQQDAIAANRAAENFEGEGRRRRRRRR